MLEHTKEYHDGVVSENPLEDYVMELHSVEKDALRRICKEAARLRRTDEGEDDRLKTYFESVTDTDTPRRIQRHGTGADVGRLGDRQCDVNDGNDGEETRGCQAERMTTTTIKLMNNKLEWFNMKAVQLQ